MFTKMVDLAYTDEEKAEKFPGMTEEAAPDFPYGLCISLDECTLRKLRLEDVPEVGDTIDLRAFGRVIGVRMEAREGNEAHCCVEIQLTQAAAEDEDDEEPGEDDDDDY